MELARQLLGVGFVLALLFALLWLQRKKGALTFSSRSRDGNQAIELIERLPLTARHSVHLLRIGDRSLLLGVHDSGFTLLSEDQHPRSAKS